MIHLRGWKDPDSLITGVTILEPLEVRRWVEFSVGLSSRLRLPLWAAASMPRRPRRPRRSMAIMRRAMPHPIWSAGFRRPGLRLRWRLAPSRLEVSMLRRGLGVVLAAALALAVAAPAMADPHDHDWHGGGDWH